MAATSTSSPPASSPPTLTEGGGVQRQRSSVRGFARGYLVAYNVVQSAGWGIVLLRTLQYLIDNGFDSAVQKGVVPELYTSVRDPLRIYQTLAFLEVIHAMIGIVPSGAMLTLIQISSRLMILWGLAEGVPGVSESVGTLIILLGWSITEVIRYAYYACNLIGNTPYYLTYLRYTLFYVLYPTGVLGELVLLFAALPVTRASQQWSISLPNPANMAFSFYYMLIGMITLYLPLFPQLYCHMINQRRKIITKPKTE